MTDTDSDAFVDWTVALLLERRVVAGGSGLGALVGELWEDCLRRVLRSALSTTAGAGLGEGEREDDLDSFLELLPRPRLLPPFLPREDRGLSGVLDRDLVQTDFFVLSKSKMC